VQLPRSFLQRILNLTERAVCQKELEYFLQRTGELDENEPVLAQFPVYLLSGASTVVCGQHCRAARCCSHVLQLRMIVLTKTELQVREAPRHCPDVVRRCPPEYFCQGIPKLLDRVCCPLF
jgi:hypothetical protein